MHCSWLCRDMASKFGSDQIGNPVIDWPSKCCGIFWPMNCNFRPKLDHTMQNQLQAKAGWIQIVSVTMKRAFWKWIHTRVLVNTLISIGSGWIVGWNGCVMDQWIFSYSLDLDGSLVGLDVGWIGQYFEIHWIWMDWILDGLVNTLIRMDWWLN